MAGPDNTAKTNTAGTAVQDSPRDRLVTPSFNRDEALLEQRTAAATTKDDVTYGGKTYDIANEAEGRIDFIAALGKRNTEINTILGDKTLKLTDAQNMRLRSESELNTQIGKQLEAYAAAGTLQDRTTALNNIKKLITRSEAFRAAYEKEPATKIAANPVSQTQGGGSRVNPQQNQPTEQEQQTQRETRERQQALSSMKPATNINYPQENMISNSTLRGAVNLGGGLLGRGGAGNTKKADTSTQPAMTAAYNSIQELAKTDPVKAGALAQQYNTVVRDIEGANQKTIDKARADSLKLIKDIRAATPNDKLAFNQTEQQTLFGRIDSKEMKNAGLEAQYKLLKKAIEAGALTPAQEIELVGYLNQYSKN
jgi:hypothetical protein